MTGNLYSFFFFYNNNKSQGLVPALSNRQTLSSRLLDLQGKLQDRQGSTDKPCLQKTQTNKQTMAQRLVFTRVCAHRNQKESDSLTLELQALGNCLMWVLGADPGPLPEQEALLTAEPSTTHV